LSTKAVEGTGLLRNSDSVTVTACNWQDPKTTIRLANARVDTDSIVSKIPKKVWEELGVKPLFKHWQSHKPTGLVLFKLRGHVATDSVIVTGGRTVLSLPLLTSMGYWGEPETGILYWNMPRL
jgi:hypothetical protein